ncbi:hypothetical protein AZ468_24225 (plasmid) [Vibrio europaeus]|uniref:Uncharacterized protein n=1 Tax=Vibrio europaeus TaxID=300876 RepID=A0A178J4D0_9VIBR|nr:hypothetical protein AZ468_24225 [Vibrio europaeus]
MTFLTKLRCLIWPYYVANSVRILMNKCEIIGSCHFIMILNNKFKCLINNDINLNKSGYNDLC